MPETSLSPEKRIYALMESHLNCPAETITPAARLTEDLELTSLDRETLRILLNREFGLELTAEDCAGFNAVEDMVGVVLERIAA